VQKKQEAIKGAQEGRMTPEIKKDLAKAAKIIPGIKNNSTLSSEEKQTALAELKSQLLVEYGDEHRLLIKALFGEEDDLSSQIELMLNR